MLELANSQHIEGKLRRGRADLDLQRTLLGEAIDEAPVLVFVADDEGRYVAVNRQACVTLGYSRRDLLGMTVPEVAVAPEAPELYETMLKEGRLEGTTPMKAEARSPDNLVWTVKRLWIVQRPMTPAKALDEGEQPEQNLQSARTGVPVSMPSDTNPGAALFFDTFLFLLLLPLLPIWIGLRHAGILPWTLQARCRSWGRHGTPVVLRWRVTGDAESHRAFQDIVSALERGDEAPVIAGAQRVR